MVARTEQNILDVVSAMEYGKTTIGCNLEKGLLLMQLLNMIF
jgi:hypothetical protein